MRELEHQEQVSLFNWSKYHEEKFPVLKMLFAIPNGGHRHISVAKKMKAEGVKAGVPDIFLATPNQDSSGLFIEMKIKPNRPTDNQQRWLTALEREGYKTAVCYSDQAAREVIVEYLGLPVEIVGRHKF